MSHTEDHININSRGFWLTIPAIERLNRARLSLAVLIGILGLLFAACMGVIASRAALGPDAPEWLWTLPSSISLGAIALGALAFILLGWTLAMFILGPVERLGKAAERILQGERNVTIPLEHDYAEAQFLSVMLNRMAAQIDDMRQDMELLVRERTVQLNLTQNQLQDALARQRASEKEQQRLVAKLHDLAHTDPLTGVFNRRAFDQVTESQLRLAQKWGRGLGVMLLDIDNFKRINDAHGHQAGDEVLCAVAERCLSVLRRDDVMGRYGGEEFAFVLPGINEQSALDVGERVRAIVAQTPVNTIAGPLSVSVSIGIAIIDATLLGPPTETEKENKTGESNPPLSPEALIRRADAAQYRAKQAGKNRVMLAEQVS